MSKQQVQGVNATTSIPDDLKTVADGDGGATQSTGLLGTFARKALYNGATWDRQRGNVETGALITHTAASAGVNGTDQTNYNGRGLMVVVDITAISGTTPTLTVTIQGKDPTSGKYFTLLASAALNATGTTVLRVYPGLTAAANTTASDVLPRTWRVISAIGGTGPSVTATVAGVVIL